MGDKGVVAVPVEFVETSGGGGGAPRIDWAAIEAANAGMMQPSSDTDEEYARRILFARVRGASHVPNTPHHSTHDIFYDLYAWICDILGIPTTYTLVSIIYIYIVCSLSRLY